eukprot:7977112-Alexandrium_andersonii.AAC.1
MCIRDRCPPWRGPRAAKGARGSSEWSPPSPSRRVALPGPHFCGAIRRCPGRARSLLPPLLGGPARSPTCPVCPR